jgi:hypothetical protein
MKNADDSADDKDRLIARVSDYRTLLETTRPLLIIKVTLLSSRLPIYRDQPIFFKTDDCPGEAALKRGEIIYPDPSGQTATSAEGLADTTVPPQTSSSLTLRIYIGLS